MNLATWKSIKSPIMQEVRINLKKKAEKGQASIPRKEANRTWREDILGILSDEQKKQRKEKRQQSSKQRTFKKVDEYED